MRREIKMRQPARQCQLAARGRIGIAATRALAPVQSHMAAARRPAIARLGRLSRQLHAAGSTAPAVTARVGIVGGLGVGAGLHYYQQLAAAHADAPLELAMVHTQINTVLGLVDAGDKAGLASYLSAVIGDLKAAGATFAVVPAVTPHYCAAELKAASPLPLVDMLECIRDEVQARELKRVALFGTRAVQESILFGQLDGVAEVVLPPAEEVAMIGAETRRLLEIFLMFIPSLSWG